MTEALLACGAKVVAPYVLAGGILSAKYATGVAAGWPVRSTRPRWEGAVRAARELAALAAEVGTTPAVLAMAFVLTNSLVATILFGADFARSRSARTWRPPKSSARSRRASSSGCERSGSEGALAADGVRRRGGRHRADARRRHGARGAQRAGRGSAGGAPHGAGQQRRAARVGRGVGLRRRGGAQRVGRALQRGEARGRAVPRLARPEGDPARRRARRRPGARAAARPSPGAAVQSVEPQGGDLLHRAAAAVRLARRSGAARRAAHDRDRGGRVAGVAVGLRDVVPRAGDVLRRRRCAARWTASQARSSAGWACASRRRGADRRHQRERQQRDGQRAGDEGRAARACTGRRCPRARPAPRRPRRPATDGTERPEQASTPGAARARAPRRGAATATASDVHRPATR